MCPECRREVPAKASQKSVFEAHGLDAPDTLFESPGCESCHGYGHAGRTGVFQITEVSQDMAYSLAAGMSPRELVEMFRQGKTPSLAQEALAKAKTGTVSFESALLVNGNQRIVSPT